MRERERERERGYVVRKSKANDRLETGTTTPGVEEELVFFSLNFFFSNMMLWFSAGFSFIFLFYNGLSFLLQHIFYVAAAHRAEEWR